MTVLRALDQRDRPEHAHPEPGVAEELLTVDGHHHDAVRARLPSDTTEPALDGVAQTLENRREQDGVLEAVAAPAPHHELGLHGLERHPGVLVEQHIDVVEREGSDMRLVEGVESGSGRRFGGRTDPR